MWVEAWDEVFIRTTRPRVNDAVVDPTAWTAWWPRTTATSAGAGGVDLMIRPMWPIPQVHHLRVEVKRVRPRDKGVELHIDGDVSGSAEFFHLDETDGVVVNWLLRAESTQPDWRARWWLAAHRGWVRRGLTDLKRRLERGRVPGAEPHPDLLAHQTLERQVFAAENAVLAAEKAVAAATRLLEEAPR